jgi:YD repeat-containing protein
VGNRSAISEWQSGTPAHYTTFTVFDPFGRAQLVTAPDNRKTNHRHRGSCGHQSWWYVVTSGDGVTYNDGSTDPSNKQEVSQDFDAMGRLCRVQEKDGLDARYGYTVRGDLASVSLKYGSAPSEHQDRSFGYDARGFLKAETHPETGQYLYERIDARGHATIKRHANQDAGFSLGFAYDAYERLTTVWDRLGSRDLKVWEYAEDNGPNGDMKKGKVVRATRYNYREVPFNPGLTPTSRWWRNTPMPGRAVGSHRGAPS